MESVKVKLHVKIGWLFMLAVILCNSCEYEPSDVYNNPANKDIEAPEIEVVKFSLGDVNDTIYLYTSKPVQFQFNSSKQEIIAVEFVLDNKSIETVYSDNGWFYLYGGELTDGLHTLSLQIYTATGTGSIAEQLGAEAFVFSREWTLVIDKNHKISTKTEIVDGYLKVSWEKYRANDFKEYVVNRTVGWGSSVEVRRLRSNEFVDSAYVGEGGKYTIWINDLYNEQTYWCELELKKDFPVLAAKAVENNLYQLYWHKSKYYGAIGKYEASGTLNYATTFDKTSFSPNDTVFESVRANFSDRAEFTMSLVPAKPNSLYQSEYEYAFKNYSTIRVGNYITNAALYSCEMLQIGKDGFSFRVDGDSLMRYSFDQKKVIQKLGYPLIGCGASNFRRASVSSSGKSLTAYVGCSDDVLMVDSENLYNYKVHDLRPYSGQMYVPEVPISDVGLAIVNSTDRVLYLYDFNTGTAVQYTPEDDYTSAFGEKISPDGRYLFLRDHTFKLVKYENGQFTNIGTYPDFSWPSYYEFDPSNPKQVVEWNQDNFCVRSIENFSVIRQYTLSDEYISNIDYSRGEILTRKAGHFYIRSFLTGEIIKDITIPSTSRCYLVNRMLLSEDGVIHYIN